MERGSTSRCSHPSFPSVEIPSKTSSVVSVMEEPSPQGTPELYGVESPAWPLPGGFYHGVSLGKDIEHTGFSSEPANPSKNARENPVKILLLDFAKEKSIIKWYLSCWELKAIKGCCYTELLISENFTFIELNS